MPGQYHGAVRCLVSLADSLAAKPHAAFNFNEAPVHTYSESTGKLFVVSSIAIASLVGLDAVRPGNARPRMPILYRGRGARIAVLVFFFDLASVPKFNLV
ncbi:hypothetical protein HBI56_218180 [Parastagonospora nodorum]|nr:hypothetical protein HBH56_225870 [Parastagonospora nodorum]KAH3935936.1 hypothetical protein HBH54_032850 [Parastagonospora nodorum]KAH3957569.1 hypothetical protein HBH51_222790 [Parastagonospora nodorum]KAH3988882.1 hypothetical protein HBH52_022020 [Parastagonospora nodorum]KAH3992252.1 hypothetical protein HBI10_220170 [Parastagonospora nodorum]